MYCEFCSWTKKIYNYFLRLLNPFRKLCYICLLYHLSTLYNMHKYICWIFPTRVFLAFVFFLSVHICWHSLCKFLPHQNKHIGWHCQPIYPLPVYSVNNPLRVYLSTSLSSSCQWACDGRTFCWGAICLYLSSVCRAPCCVSPVCL
jgi:hypothetical protein